MPDLKLQIKLILGRHEGRGSAITGRALAQMLGYKDDRAIRQAIRELRADHFPVLSATDSPAGYFLPLNQGEVTDCLEQNKSRLIEDAKVIRDIKLGAAMWLLPAVQRSLW